MGGSGRRSGVVRLFRGSRVETRGSLLRGDGNVPGGCGFHDFAKGLKTLRK